MKLTLKEIADKIGGTLVGCDMTVTDLVTDSRNAKYGALFAAIKGENADGFDFIKTIDDTDGIAYLTDRAPEGVKNPYILTDDVVRAIGGIAKLHLESLDVKVVAVTGSVGKTTTKNYIAKALSPKYKVHATPGNFNNELGVPLTILGANASHDVLVLEMGMRGMGQIDYLCSIARPDIAVITNIKGCHMELLGSLENIRDAKCEILGNLAPDGVAVLNGDDSMLLNVDIPQRIIRYGMEMPEECDVYADNVMFGSFDAFVGFEDYPMTLSLPGEHNIYNALAALAVADALHVDIFSAVMEVENYSGDGVRQNIYKCMGITIFDDTYNASPASMTASLRVLGGMDARRVAVLGDMLELGADEAKLHALLATDIIANGVSLVVCIGSLMKNLYDALLNVEKYYCKDNDEALKVLLETVKEGDTVLFKGSHAMALDKLIKRFEEAYDI